MSRLITLICSSFAHNKPSLHQAGHWNVVCAVQCNFQMRSGKGITSGRPSSKQRAGANFVAHRDLDRRPLTS